MVPFASGCFRKLLPYRRRAARETLLRRFPAGNRKWTSASTSPHPNSNRIGSSTSIKANTIRINDNIATVLNNVAGITKDVKGTIVWAADEVVYAPEIAVTDVRIDAIG